jgi:DNA processing protein
VARPDDLSAWLRLLRTPGIGHDAARRLLAACGSPAAVFSAPPATLRELIGGPPATALAATPERHAELLAATIGWLDADPAHHVLTLDDAGYPPPLLEIADPPLLLYAHGRLALLGAPALAIVGSRNPTAQGVDNARDFARHLSQAGLTIVSGMALGIDGAAHEGGLAGSGSTIAVVGTGLDRIYPARHRALAHRIAKDGLLLSEFDLGTPPLAENFPRRNRLIAGLSRGTLVSRPHCLRAR